MFVGPRQNKHSQEWNRGPKHNLLNNILELIFRFLLRKLRDLLASKFVLM